jgi:hypothetical protein
MNTAEVYTTIVAIATTRLPLNRPPSSSFGCGSTGARLDRTAGFDEAAARVDMIAPRVD